MTPRHLPDVTTSPLRPAKLAHIVLRVSDLQRSRDWYIKVLHAWPAFENEMLSFLAYDDEHHRIGLVARENLRQASDQYSGMEHVAFSFTNLGELFATYRRLKKADTVPYWTVNHGPTISFYYKDPDGNRVELQYDVFSRAEDLEAFFHGGAYEKNFIGIGFDPEELISRYEAGEPLDSLTARPALPPGKTSWDMLVT